MPMRHVLLPPLFACLLVAAPILPGGSDAARAQAGAASPAPAPMGWRSGAEARAIESRIDGLLRRMTLEEKVGQLHLYGRREGFDHGEIRAGRVGNVMNFISPAEVAAVQKAARESRLGIPLLIGLDAVHGVSTYFPLPLGQAATFNPALVEEAALWTGREARALGVNWTFAPMVDMGRDPRWGRLLEGAGEDVHLANVIAAARTRGYQAGGVAATVKHFVGYGGGEAGRDYNTAWIPAEQLHDLHLPPFRASLDAGSLSVMAAFNSVNGVPATAHKPMLQDLLRGRWGFRGLVVSDFGSIPELMAHGIARDEAEAARKALAAGVDIDMMGFVYARHLAAEVRAGRVPMAQLDRAVRRVLRVKFHAGMDRIADIDPRTAEAALQSAPALDAARRIARESIILLENDGILPLRAERSARVAVIGALARPDQERVWTDPAGVPRKPIEGMDAALARLLGPGVSIGFAPGVNNYCGHAFADRDGALALAREADAIVAKLGEDCEFMGEGASRTRLTLPGVQDELLEALIATGKPVILVLATGRPLVLSHLKGRVAALVQTFHAGSEGRTAIAEVLTGAFNPSGKTPMSFPRSVGQIPVYYDHLPTGRPETPGRFRYESIFIDERNTPLYPFGYGQSYTRFSFDELQVETPMVMAGGAARISVRITNAGAQMGQEVAQLYVRQPLASISRPVRQLKAFTKLALKPGENRRVTFMVEARDLGYHDAQGRLVIEPGLFDVYVGNSSLATLKGSFTLAAGARP
jgi:beta-glucosidase